MKAVNSEKRKRNFEKKKKKQQEVRVKKSAIRIVSEYIEKLNKIKL